MTTLTPLLIHYGYWLIIPIAIFEGPFVMMLSGLFIKLGIFQFAPAYILLMIGDLLADVGWYAVGYYVGEKFIKKFGKFFSITDESVNIVKNIFHKYHNTILIASKLTMGFGFALVTLVTAGMVRIPFRKYLALNILGQFVWTGILMGVGYIFGNLYIHINNTFGEISTYALIVIAFIALIGFGKYVRKQMVKKFA